MPYPLFWIGSANFGDAVNPILYKAITGREPIYSDQSPKTLAIGSIMHGALPNDIVWGTGCMSKEMELHCDSTTRILATRGPLTDRLIEKTGAKPTGVHGDPSILLPKFFPMKAEKKYKLGIIPHYIDYEQVELMTRPESKLIRVFDHPLEVIKQICECEKVISSSLHGIIVAEAYGVPAVWVEFSDKVYGQGFKFKDYYAGTGRIINPEDLRNGNFGFYFNWQKPEYDERLLSTCPFDWDPRWEVELPNCTGRIKRMAELIEPGIVMDIGAGKMELKEFLPEGCKYIPVDFVKRCEDTILCDLNGKKDFPVCDTAVFSGVLEYIKDIQETLYALKTKIIIASYATWELNSDINNRRFNGWVNDFTESDIMTLFISCGFECLYREVLGTQVIYKFQLENKIK
jgi:pyruvyltransferase